MEEKYAINTKKKKKSSTVIIHISIIRINDLRPSNFYATINNIFILRRGEEKKVGIFVKIPRKKEKNVFDEAALRRVNNQLRKSRKCQSL